MPVSANKRLYRNLVDAVVSALREINQENRYADKVLERILRSNPKWGARDRAFIAESVYDVVRHQRLLQVLSQELCNDATSLETWVGIYLLQQGYDLPAWPVFEKTVSIDYRDVNARIAAISSHAVLYSYPDWLYARLSDELGASRWSKESILLNQPADVFLRVNTLKVHPQKLKALLEEEGIYTEETGPWNYTLRLLKRQNVFRSAYFKQGYFEVQDWSSQQVAPLLAPEPGMRVVDACAGAGGKTLHLAALMKNKGKIIAMDTEAWKLKVLMERANRAGISIIETRVIDSSKTVKRLENSADALLTDVPCSGLGVLRRNPDTKWKLSQDSIERTRGIQQEILAQYSGMLHKDGSFVYATCSILPSENEQQVAGFLERSDDFQLVSQRTIYPSEFGADGFFMAQLKRVM